MTRDEHLAWCKRQALEYLECGDLKSAVASMLSDMSKHPDLGVSSHLSALGIMYVSQGDFIGVRRFIEGFN